MRVQWFGESWGAPINDDCEHVDTPVGEVCPSCDEPILAEDRGVRMWHIGGEQSGYHPYHWECHLRSVIGSVGHQRGLCSCPGNPGVLDDPPGVSRRVAARMACDYFYGRHTYSERRN